jgi:hypothetical protein
MDLAEGQYCVLLNEEAQGWNPTTPFDIALDWRFPSRDAAEGCCEALNRLLGYRRFRVGFGLECAAGGHLQSAQIT